MATASSLLCFAARRARRPRATRPGPGPRAATVHRAARRLQSSRRLRRLDCLVGAARHGLGGNLPPRPYTADRRPTARRPAPDPTRQPTALGDTSLGLDAPRFGQHPADRGDHQRRRDRHADDGHDGHHAATPIVVSGRPDGQVVVQASRLHMQPLAATPRNGRSFCASGFRVTVVVAQDGVDADRRPSTGSPGRAADSIRRLIIGGSFSRWKTALARPPFDTPRAS